MSTVRLFPAGSVVAVPVASCQLLAFMVRSRTKVTAANVSDASLVDRPHPIAKQDTRSKIWS